MTGKNVSARENEGKVITRDAADLLIDLLQVLL
jgi:hypothetical protein